MKIEELLEAAAWQKSSGKNKNGGLNKKGVASYRREHPGSKLQTAVTTKPSKLKKGSKASKRRKSFCARMKGMKKHRTGAKTAHNPNSRINKSLRKWHCESIEEMKELVMIAEAYLEEKAKQRLDAKCWTGKHKEGTKMKGGIRVNNCVPNESIEEVWSQKYKKSINCSHPKGFSQKAHCAGKKKHNESYEMEMVCEDCGMCETHGNLNEIKKGQKDSNGFTKCWSGYHAQGTKKSSTTGKSVRNCVKNENMDHEMDGQAVTELKAALLAHKKKLQTATNDETYDTIDKIMTRIAKSHGISGQKLHDMWVKQYGQIPDTWIMKEAANAAQQAAIAIAKKKDKGVDENFADGKGPGRAGDSARHGIPKHATMSELEKASHAKGRKGQLARWQMNMRNGKNK